mmetsp:Transcript_21197/g.57037  ORF Transcript_21197/g.57037 Transcript_21197/m.57037 type:complete len:219 (+) Transcript_21197:790-1446(+)
MRVALSWRFAIASASAAICRRCSSNSAIICLFSSSIAAFISAACRSSFCRSSSADASMLALLRLECRSRSASFRSSTFSPSALARSRSALSRSAKISVINSFSRFSSSIEDFALFQVVTPDFARPPSILPLNRETLACVVTACSSCCVRTASSSASIAFNFALSLRASSCSARFASMAACLFCSSSILRFSCASLLFSTCERASAVLRSAWILISSAD